MKIFKELLIPTLLATSVISGCGFDSDNLYVAETPASVAQRLPGDDYDSEPFETSGDVGSLASTPTAQLDGASVFNEVPAEGCELAILVERKIIAVTQSVSNIRQRLRASYAEDTKLLIDASHAVETKFQTIAKTNNFWK